MIKAIKYIIITLVIFIAIPFLTLALTFAYMIFTESTKDESQTPSGITRQAIDTKNIHLCDTISEPLAGLSGSSNEILIGRCYEEYVKVNPSKKACDGVTHTNTYCIITLAITMKDASVCKDDYYCVSRVANITNDINVCQIIKDTTKEKQCEDFFEPIPKP